MTQAPRTCRAHPPSCPGRTSTTCHVSMLLPTNLYASDNTPFPIARTSTSPQLRALTQKNRYERNTGDERESGRDAGQVTDAGRGGRDRGARYRVSTLNAWRSQRTGLPYVLYGAWSDTGPGCGGPDTPQHGTAGVSWRGHPAHTMCPKCARFRKQEWFRDREALEPMPSRAPDRIRTCNLLIRSQLLWYI